MNTKAILREQTILKYDNYILLRIYVFVCFYICVLYQYRVSLAALISTFLFVHLHLHSEDTYAWCCIPDSL